MVHVEVTDNERAEEAERLTKAAPVPLPNGCESVTNGQPHPTSRARAAWRTECNNAQPGGPLPTFFEGLTP